MPHDIIDNQEEKLLDHISQILPSTQQAKFAVGYFFLSGLKPLRKYLPKLEEVRLVIGNTTDHETIETLAQGYCHIAPVREALEDWQFRKRALQKQMVVQTRVNLREVLALSDQTDEDQETIRIVSRLVEDGKFKVRVYTKGRLHSKAYIFDYGKIFDAQGHVLPREEHGIAIVGSSNLTLSGLTHNTELNVIVQGNSNHAALVRWFDKLWDDSRDFNKDLMHELRHSWAIGVVDEQEGQDVFVRPYDIYMKTLYELVKERLEDGDEQEILWDDEITKRLADFQKVAVRQAIQIIRDYGGAFIADVVGMGKSYVGAAIVKHFERTDHVRPLIICPASLVDMWESYNEVYDLNARVLSMGYLREDTEGLTRFLVDNVKYRDRDFVLIDESHNFRHPDTQRYKVVETFLATGRRCCFLTATPRNKSAWDIYYQIKLFHQDDRTDFPVDPPDLREYFKLIEQGEKNLPDLLSNILIRRTRNHILRWYGFDAETHQPVDPSHFEDYVDGTRRAYVPVGGRHNFFPKRELHTIEYNIEDTYQGLYHQLRGYLGKAQRQQLTTPTEGELTYARYGLWHYVLREYQQREPYASLHRAGTNLCGLMRVLLFKRFESSVYAFKETVRRLLSMHQSFLVALDEGIVPAGEEAQNILYESDFSEEVDLLAALRSVSKRYDAQHFDVLRLHEHIKHDIELLQQILRLVGPITPKQDAKLQALKNWLSKKPLKDGKRLIFSQYADTARYLFDNLNPNGECDDIEVIYSNDKSRGKLVGRFAPKANPEYRFTKGECELTTVIATDVLAEGLNLQDCDKVINYDLHWNPVRLIQRFGRIDRIGSEHDVIYGYNFLPETGIERNLHLKEKLRNRIQEIHNTIGEDAAILDPTEQLNEEAMYAIYERDGSQLGLFEQEEEFLDLNEAEEILRQLRSDQPHEYERIADLRDGIRTAASRREKRLYVFFQAGRYQQLMLLDADGETITRDIPRVLGAIKCGPNLKGSPLPSGYNAAVMRVKEQFIEEIKHREAERKYSTSLSHGQHYILRELRVLFEISSDEGIKPRINIVEKAFRASITGAVNRELNKLRRNSISGESLLEELTKLYHEHNMREWIDRRGSLPEDQAIPRIICSETFE